MKKIKVRVTQKMNHSMSYKCGEINQSIIIQEIQKKICGHTHKIN